MEIAVSSVRATQTQEVFELHHLTDLHRDDLDHAEKELGERIKHIAETPNARWVGGGDYGSLILPNDPRFQTGMESVHRMPDVYVESTTEVLMPIRDKCVGFGIGNHEQTIGKYYHRGVGAEVARNLGVPHLYLGVRGWVILNFELNKRSVPLHCFTYHGWSAGRLKGRKALQAERDLGSWEADVFLLGHDHVPYSDIWYSEKPSGSKSGWKIRQRPRAYINGGSWTYGQRPPMKNKVGLKPSEFPNEAWVEGRNFRPQPPANPILLVHVDFGSGVKQKTDTQSASVGRSAGFDFEINTRGNRYEY